MCGDSFHKTFNLDSNVISLGAPFLPLRAPHMNHINTSIRRRRRRKTPPIEFFHTIDPRRAQRTSASMRAGCRRTRAQIWDFRIGYKYLSDLSVRVCECVYVCV